MSFQLVLGARRLAAPLLLAGSGSSAAVLCSSSSSSSSFSSISLSPSSSSSSLLSQHWTARLSGVNSHSNVRSSSRSFASSAWKIKRAELAELKRKARLAKKPDPQSPVWVDHNPEDRAEPAFSSYPELGNNPDLKFAIISTMGTQFKVVPGDLLMVGRMKADINQNVVFPRVLLQATVGHTVIGRPVIPGAAVHGTVEEHTNTQRILVFKKKRRKGYKKMQGFAESVSLIRINDIWEGEESANGREAPAWVSEISDAVLAHRYVLKLPSFGGLENSGVAAKNWAEEHHNPSPEYVESEMEEVDEAEGSEAEQEAPQRERAAA